MFVRHSVSARLAVFAAGATLLLTACSAGNTSAPAASASENAAGSSGSVVDTREDSDLGTILVDADGRTLYLFEKDENGQSSCDSVCASIWPPYTTDGDPQAQGDGQSAMLGATERSDGSSQVTYNDHPLYYYEPDSGQSTKGEGLDQFGAEWYVVSPGGDKVEEGGEGS